ncbi:MAG: helix-turn-helix domain-containing protein [Alistipes sp.]|nr:helix-turn-helix domain-containing protein [Alistipes sp.]
MEAIKVFLNELIRCDIVNDYKGHLSYNNVSLEETSEVFQRRLHSLYENALIEVPFLSAYTKEGFVSIISKYSESQLLFDVPNDSHLLAMNREIEAGNNNVSLKKERDFVKMICECVSLQKYYLKEFADVIGCNVDVVCNEQEQPLDIEQTPSIEGDIIKGVKGLSDYLGCGVNTAQDIINSKILEKKKIQYRAGRCWRFKKDKLAELLEKEPEILKYRGRR